MRQLRTNGAQGQVHPEVPDKEPDRRGGGGRRAGGERVWDIRGAEDVREAAVLCELRCS